MKISDDKIALIDLDGTVADYDGALDRGMLPLYGVNEKIYTGWDEIPPHIEARRDLVKRQPGFWRQLPRLELGFQIVEILKGMQFELHVLTKGPVKTTNAWTEKVEWCKEYLPEANVTITQDKSLVYGRILVDDYPPYFEKWLVVRPRGLVICVAHSWNEKYAADKDPHPNVIRYDGTNLQQVKEMIQKSFDRKTANEI